MLAATIAMSESRHELLVTSALTIALKTISEADESARKRFESWQARYVEAMPR